MNPIPYNQLFDIDGLKHAIKEAERESDAFGKAATSDFKRINTVVKSLTEQLKELGVVMSKPINITQESGQRQVVELSRKVSELTNQINTQKAAIESLNRVMTDQKKAINDAKVAAAQYNAESAKSRSETAKGRQAEQDHKTAIAATTLEMKQMALATAQARQATTAAAGSYKEAQNRLRELGQQIRNAEGGFENMTPEIRAQIKEYNRLNQALKDFDAQMGNHQRNVGNYKLGISSLTDQLKSLALSYISITGALTAVSFVFNTSLKLDAVRTSLEFTLKSVGAATDKLRELQATANRLGLNFGTLADTYAMFAGAAKAANFPLAETDKIFNAVAGAAARFHLSSDQLSGALLAIQQMISKGNVQAEELRGQLGERLPGAFSIAARAMGVTEKELGKLLQTGQVTANELLPKLADELNKTFDLTATTKVDSLTASFERLKNVFTGAVNENSNINGFFKTILDGLTSLSTELTRLVNSRSWSDFFRRIGDFSGTTTQNIDLAYNVRDRFDSSVNAKNGLTKQTPYGFQALSQKQIIDLLPQYQKALREASAAYVQYAEGIESGRLKDSGNFKDYKNNYLELKSLVTQLSAAYKTAAKDIPKATKEIADADLKSVNDIRKRITDLQKLDGSAIAGSELNNRINALKARLKELNPETIKVKEGFAALEEQIQKAMHALQDQVLVDYVKNRGKESEQTRKLAGEYENLITLYNKVAEAKKNAILDASKQQRIKLLGSLLPAAQRSAGAVLSNDDVAKLNLVDQKANLNSDINSLQDSLDDVVQRYKVSNLQILSDYRSRKITKLQYDDAINKSEKDQLDDAYFYENSLLAARLNLEKLTNGETSKNYRALRNQMIDLDDRYYKARLKNEEDSLALAKKNTDELIAYLKKASNDVAKLSGSEGLGRLFDNVADSLILGIGKGQKAIENIAQLGENAILTYTDFAIMSSDRRIAALQREADHELKIAGDNKDAKERIEAEYNRKVEAERRKQAVLRKAQAVAEIAINTAVAVTKVMAQGGIISPLLIPGIIALGAIEAAIVIAQPAYEKGRKDGPAELALVNEKGPEAIGQKGKYRIANGGKKGLTWLNKHDEVIPAHLTDQMMISGMIQRGSEISDRAAIANSSYNYYMMQAMGGGIDYNRMAGAFNEAVSGIPVSEQHWDERGYHESIRIKNTRMEGIKKRNRF